MNQAWRRRFHWVTETRIGRLWDCISQAELVAAVRRRGRGDSDEDEDLGLPHSPPASPPTDKAEKALFRPSQLQHLATY
ncbi:hypothetical protein KGM_207431 [Danaus plexippus plexippus]|uniref:Uncharacterized protein n=1 Tax=Danaus plexippus plexippus TaxID=278856 RepID=A0A212FKG0_DANPL|nr:hypothetical protein KGM_207431 [Danaus plexippus plexippus]